MDVTISHDLTGSIDYTFTPVTTIMNNIILSLAIAKGTWWHDPNFGMTRRTRLKLTPATVRLIKQDAEQALQWLIDCGRAVSIEVTAERDNNNSHRVNLFVRALQNDGRLIEYTTFKGVV